MVILWILGVLHNLKIHDWLVIHLTIVVSLIVKVLILLVVITSVLRGVIILMVVIFWTFSTVVKTLLLFLLIKLFTFKIYHLLQRLYVVLKCLRYVFHLRAFSHLAQDKVQVDAFNFLLCSYKDFSLLIIFYVLQILLAEFFILFTHHSYNLIEFFSS